MYKKEIMSNKLPLNDEIVPIRQKPLTIKQQVRRAMKELILLPLVILDVIGLLYSSILQWIKTDLGNLWLDKQERRIAQQATKVTHAVSDRIYNFTFYTPNWICRYRADTFSIKEPETLKWIDMYGDGGVFFDIGANIGLYSIYYGMTKKGNVYAFEPSVFNLALLTKNINANNLQRNIRIIANPLTEANQFADFNLTTTEQGGALSAFGVDFGQDGKPLSKVFSYQTLGFTLDFLFEAGMLKEIPAMIKIDVDGIEHLILRGAIKTLSNPICKTVLVEVSKDFSLQANEVSRILKAAGFLLEDKSDNGLQQNIATSNANQIWIKN